LPVSLRATAGASSSERFICSLFTKCFFVDSSFCERVPHPFSAIRLNAYRASAHGGASLKKDTWENPQMGAQLPASPHDLAAWRRRAIRQP